MKLKNVYYLGGKEFFSFMRDPVLIIFIIHSFTTGIYIASTSRPETMQNVPIAIVDEDKSQLSNRLVSSFYPPYFKTPVMISHEEMDKGMDHGDYTFALNIPSSFERDVLSGDKPKIQLNVDATRLGQAFSGAGYIQQIVQNELGSYLSRGQASAGMPVGVANRTAFNPELNQSWFGSVIDIINGITLLSIVLTGAALIREREHGTIEHLMVMPVTPFEILASKPHLDLMVTDYRLPGGVTGVQIAEPAVKLRPELKVIFISGYPQEIRDCDSPITRKAPILAKPFDLDTLQEHILRLLA